MTKFKTILAAAALLICVMPDHAMAWGPATHMKLASDLLARADLLSGAIAALLTRHVRDYLFGNIAADVVLAKRMSRVKQFCHHWETGFAILDDARTDSGRAFGLGYLSHLAADTVAHNKFIPRQMTLTRSSLAFGHLYWELRADSTIGPYHWERLRKILGEVFDEHERSLASRLDQDALLPFTVNWRLFYRMNKFVGRRLWRKTLDRWYDMSRWPLSDNLIREYRAECLERMVDVVHRQRKAAVLHEDPNGNSALTYMKAHRRQLRQMNRRGLAKPHVYREAAAGHAPDVTDRLGPRKTSS